MPFLIRRLQLMDLTFFSAHSAVIAGRQRAINIDAWLVPDLPFSVPARVAMRYRHPDTGRIVTESRPIAKLQKNVRLHGEMVRGQGYLHYSAGDFMLLHFMNSKVTWALFRNTGRERLIFRFLSNPANSEFRRNMGIVRDPGKIQALQVLLSRYDPALFFNDEMDAIESEPSSPTVRSYIRRKISPAAFANLQRAREENGKRGELFVLERERARLTEAGYPNLAEQVTHVAADDPTAPFDIHSFEGIAAAPESARFIDVKSTSGEGKEFEMSEAEWRFAEENGDHYYVYRITQVTSAEPRCSVIRNIAALVTTGHAERRPSAFKVRLLP